MLADSVSEFREWLTRCTASEKTDLRRVEQLSDTRRIFSSNVPRKKTCISVVGEIGILGSGVDVDASFDANACAEEPMREATGAAK
jgi:hypothetical protein